MHRRLFYNEQEGLMRTAELVAPRLLRDEVTERLSSFPVFIYSPVFLLKCSR